MSSASSSFEEASVAVMLKVSLWGPRGCGKTSIFLRFKGEELSDTLPPLDEDEKWSDKLIRRGSTAFSLSLFDYNNHGRFAQLGSTVRGSDWFVVVYDITKQESFDEACAFVREQKVRQFEIAVVGNKLDLADARQVPADTAAAEVARLGCKGHMEVSAKTGAGINKLFEWICDQQMAAQSSHVAPPPVKPGIVIPNGHHDSSSGKCCAVS